MDRNGIDRTPAFIRAAEEVRLIVELVGARLVVFKEGSPSCGVRRVDIEGVKRQGCGVVTAFLMKAGYAVISDEDPVPEIL
jgi:uncharacterized protein YbbK (DUF523 family)